MTNVRIVAISYFAFAVLTALFVENVLRMGFSYASVSDPQILGEGWTLTTAIGFGLAFGTAIYLWVRKDIRTVSLEIAQELRKVTWPSMDETKTATIAVIVVSFIIAVILGLFDWGWAWVTDKIYEVPRYIGG